MAGRVVFHVDMDYFYGQVEERENPELKGKPVAVCMFPRRQGSLGAIATCNYQARQLGLHSGMACATAKIKAPETVFLPARKDYYNVVSEGIMDVLRPYCGTLEQVSVDEAYMDVTSKTGYDGVEDYIKAVKQAIYSKERLTASVGAGPNKLIAKMASSVNKPDGYTIVESGEVISFLTPKPVLKLPGVGVKTRKRLAELGVRTVGDLKKLSVDKLTGEFGAGRGRLLHEYARGIDESPVVEKHREQIGRLASLQSDTRDFSELSSLIRELTADISGWLADNHREYKTVVVVFVLEDRKVKTRSRTLPSQTGSPEVLKATAEELLRDFLKDNASKLRRLGVTASNLRDYGGQRTLGDY